MGQPSRATGEPVRPRRGLVRPGPHVSANGQNVGRRRPATFAAEAEHADWHGPTRGRSDGSPPPLLGRPQRFGRESGAAGLEGSLPRPRMARSARGLPRFWTSTPLQGGWSRVVRRAPFDRDCACDRDAARFPSAHPNSVPQPSRRWAHDRPHPSAVAASGTVSRGRSHGAVRQRTVPGLLPGLAGRTVVVGRARGRRRAVQTCRRVGPCQSECSALGPAEPSPARRRPILSIGRDVLALAGTRRPGAAGPACPVALLG